MANQIRIDKRQTIAYFVAMTYLNWSPEKNERLKAKRGISFEEIAFLIESGQILGIEENPGRPDKKIYILEIESYAFIVPFVEKDNNATFVSIPHNVFAVSADDKAISAN